MGIFLLTDDVEGLKNLIGDTLEKLRTGQVFQIQSNEVIINWKDGTRTRFTQPNMLCLGFVALTSETPLTAALRSWWLERGGVDLDCIAVPIKDSEESRRALLCSWVANKILASTESLHVGNRNLLSQNRSLRRSYGALQTAFSRLEHFVSINRLTTPVLQYETTPISYYWKPASSGAKLEQLLPILAARLSFFDLRFQKSPNATDGAIRVTLRLEPSRQIVHVWEITYRDLLNGWNSFSPPPIVDEQNEVVIEIAWSESVSAPAIGLSSRHWNEPYGALTRSHAGGCQSLAMRVWSGLQGVRSPMLASTPQKAAEAKDRLVAYPPGDLARAQQHIFAGTRIQEYASVDASAFPGRLMTHPHDGRAPTIAIFPETLPSGTTFIAALCQTMNPEASLIEYAMAVVPSDVAPEAVFDCDAPGDGFSGWWSIRPMELKRIELVLDTPATSDERLCFATRVPPNSSEHNAWATWTGVELGIGWRPKKVERVEDNFTEM